MAGDLLYHYETSEQTYKNTHCVLVQSQQLKINNVLETKRQVGYR